MACLWVLSAWGYTRELSGEGEAEEVIADGNDPFNTFDFRCKG